MLELYEPDFLFIVDLRMEVEAISIINEVAALIERTYKKIMK